jgi:hypothetical protein
MDGWIEVSIIRAHFMGLFATFLNRIGNNVDGDDILEWLIEHK